MLVLAVYFLIFTSMLTAETTPEWTVSFNKDVKWVQLTPTGHLLAGTDEGLVGINPEDGNIMWQMDELKKLEQDKINLIPLTQYAVINKGKGFLGTQNRMILIDYVSGNEKWNSDNLDIVSSMGQFIVPSKKALFIYGVNKKGKQWPRLVNMEDGSMIWENPDFFKKRNPTLFKLSGSKLALMGNQEPLFDTDETMITCMNGKAIRKWDLNTGAMIWETELKELKKAAPSPMYGYPSILFDEDNGVLYVPAVKALYAVKVSDGSLVWGEKPAKLDGIPHQLRITENGILVKGGPNSAGKEGKPFMMLLNTETGLPMWDKKFDKLKKSTAYVVKDDKAYVYSDKKIYAINIADGTYEQVAEKIKFEGKESPHSIKLTDKGLLLKSTQNVMMVGLDGSEVFHAYHKAQGGSLFGKIASTAVIAAVNVGSAMDAQARANAAASRSASGSGSASYSLITSNPYLSKRFTATVNTGQYSYILTKVEKDGDKGPGIVKVNTSTGATDGSVILGDKKPVYEVDNIESMLFYIKDKKNIQCFKM
jgi:hypothetical protein